MSADFAAPTDATPQWRAADSQGDGAGPSFSPVYEDAADVLRHAFLNVFTDRRANPFFEDSVTSGTPDSTPRNATLGEPTLQTHTAPFMPASPLMTTDGSTHRAAVSPNTAFLEMLTTPGGPLSHSAVHSGAVGWQGPESPASRRAVGHTRAAAAAPPAVPPPSHASLQPTGTLAGLPHAYTNVATAASNTNSYYSTNAGALPPYCVGGAPPTTATYMTPYGPMTFAFAGDLLPPPPPPQPKAQTSLVAESANPMCTPKTEFTLPVAGPGVEGGTAEATLPQFSDPHACVSPEWRNDATATGRPHPHGASLGNGGGNPNASGHGHTFSPMSSVASGAIASPRFNASAAGGRHHHQPQQQQQQQLNMSKSGSTPVPPSPSKSAMNATITEVFDAEFHKVFEVPTSCVVHLPPSRMNITRLVLCRNYRAGERESCAMGANCKFVHADCDYAQLPAHSIHVNYVWRETQLCTYERMPAGGSVPLRLWPESITVGPDGGVLDDGLTSSAGAPGGSHTVTLPSDCLLRTAGSALFVSKHGSNSGGGGTEALLTCEAYELDGICRHGEDCAMAHRIIVDPSTNRAFKRAPRRRHPIYATTHTSHSSAVNSPHFAPLVGSTSPLATPAARAHGQFHASGLPHGGAGSPSHPSPLHPRGSSKGSGELTSASPGAIPKMGSGTVMDAHSGTPTPASSSLGVTPATSSPFGLKMEQWVQRAVRVQLLSTLPNVTNTGRGTPAHPPAVLPSRDTSLDAAEVPPPADTVEEGAVTVVIPASMASCLSTVDAIGTLLYVPRGSDRATVLGPVTADDVLPSGQ